MFNEFEFLSLVYQQRVIDFRILNTKQTCIKRKFTIIGSFTLLILVLSKKTLIIFVKTKPENGKWRKHDTRGSMTPFSHLLSFAFELYVTTATLLNGHLYTEGYIYIFFILCIPVPIVHLSLSGNVCSKMLSAFIDCCIYSPTLQATFDHM